jgi:hypothetical protein
MSPDRAIRSTRHLGPCPRIRTDKWMIVGQDGGQSIDLGDRTLLVFSDTLLLSTHGVPEARRELPRGAAQVMDEADGAVFRANCAALVEGGDLRAGLAAPTYFCDEHGFPAEILVATEREREAGLRFWPAHGIRDGDGVHLFYLGIEGLRPSDPWGFRSVGVGLARIDSATGASRRVRIGDDWRLWPAGVEDLHLGVQTLEHDGLVYVFGSTRDGLDTSAIVARVPVGSIGDRDAYAFFDPAGERWRPGLVRAGSLGPCSSDYSVSFNPHLGRYLMTYVDAFTKQLAIRVAERPEGPYSEPEIAGRLPHAPTSDLIYLALEHPRFARDGGRRVVVSYCEPRFEMSSLLELRFR